MKTILKSQQDFKFLTSSSVWIPLSLERLQAFPKIIKGWDAPVKEYEETVYVYSLKDLMPNK